MIQNLNQKKPIITTKINKVIGITSIFMVAAFFLGFSRIAYAAPVIEIWWPSQNSELHGVQPFKGLLQGSNLDQYTMFWQVDGGAMVPMGDNYQDYPHKEATVDLSGWNWRGTGPYVLTFTAKDMSGQVIAQTTRTISTGPLQTVVAPAPAPSPTPAPIVSPTITVSTDIPAGVAANPLAGKKFYVDPNTQAAAQVQQWLTSQPANAALIKKIADNPQAIWLGNWYSDVQTKDKITGVIAKAQAQGAIPTFVLYNIPQRDCGSYSAGGANNPDGYRAWITNIANAIGSSKAVIVLEPDALAQITCLNSGDQVTRMSLLAGAVTTLKNKGGVNLYIDAGHVGWISTDAMANSLKQAGIAKADGFALNVSNYQKTSDNAAYGKDISVKTGGKHYIVDTSRNGNGSNGEWCNANGMALGAVPTSFSGDPLVDALLWIKNPGESDGTCNGGPSAGTWWPSYALDLARRAAY